jgi:hypothetical protein
MQTTGIPSWWIRVATRVPTLPSPSTTTCPRTPPLGWRGAARRLDAVFSTSTAVTTAISGTPLSVTATWATRCQAPPTPAEPGCP